MSLIYFLSVYGFSASLVCRHDARAILLFPKIYDTTLNHFLICILSDLGLDLDIDSIVKAITFREKKGRIEHAHTVTHSSEYHFVLHMAGSKIIQI